jgi:hypothetical protein
MDIFTAMFYSWWKLLLYGRATLLFSAGLWYVLYARRKIISSCRVIAFLYLILFVYSFFLNKQTRHGRNIVSFCFFLFICGRAKCLSREQCVWVTSARVVALYSSFSLQKNLERWPAALYEAGRSVLTLRWLMSYIYIYIYIYIWSAYSWYF